MVRALSCRRAVGAFAVVVGSGALATGHAQEDRKHFDVAPGPAAVQLARFAAQSRLNILAMGDMLAGFRTNAVVGDYSVSEALDRLLAGTGLVSRMDPAGLVVVPAAAGKDKPGVQAVVRTAPEVPVEVRVVGMRASQQSSISTKKYADTSLDAVVAEDVGSFPDKNVGEAISRIAGIALDRGDYGEGINVGLRGLNSDMTRVEIDGLGVISAAGGALQGADDRATEFRELPSDLIKSVEVIKGAAAADTEGGLAGSIQIRTRTGFDFKKPFVSGRLAATKNSINNQWGPDQNLVFANQFLGGRLGLVGTVNRSRAYNENHRQDLSNNSNNGPSLLWDFDQSPEKTFNFNPGTLSKTDPSVDQPLGSSPFSLTPRDVVTRAADAKTKADCYASIPLLTAAQLGTLANRDRGPAAYERSLELASCLNQWNDYTPTSIRNFVKRQDDLRTSADLRIDFKVDDRLRLFVKGTRQNRLVWDTFLYQALGQFDGLGSINTASYSGPTFTDDAATNVRSAVAATGYATLPGLSVRSNAVPVTGVLTNVDPASVLVDATHHVVRATIADGTVDTTKQFDRIDTRNTYLQLGGSYRNGPLKVDVALGQVRSSFMREVHRLGISYVYGPVTLQAMPDGLWSYSFPVGSTYSQTAVANYVQLAAQAARSAVAATVNNPASPAYAASQLPLVGPGMRVEYSPYASETAERSNKIDVAYRLDDKLPALRALRFGIDDRDYRNKSWSPGGYQMTPALGTYGQPGYVAPVVIPSSIYRKSWIVPCEDTAGSLAPGGLPCAYGYTSQTNLSETRQGVVTMTPQKYQDLLSQIMRVPTAPFFNSARNRPSGLLDGWYDLDVMKAIALSGLKNFDTGCVKFCQANDGNTYEQAVNGIHERVSAAYFMADYKFDQLPWTVEGNVGLRYVHTSETGSGLFTLNSITKTSSFNPASPDAAQGVATTFLTKITSVNDSVTNVLPSFNAATWLQPDTLVFRYNWARMIGRPKVSQLVPASSCTYDERQADQGTAMVCTGRLGNPGLRPLVSDNQNFSLEYYPGKDTMLNLAYFTHKGITGAPILATLDGVRLFKGTDEVDPASGRSLSSLGFSVPTYVNGPAISRNGWELAAKTALSFLPWRLRYTGIDFDLTRIRARNNQAQYRDLNSGDILPPALEPKQTMNLSLWYDDGALQARVALQTVATRFVCIAPCNGSTGAANYPADGATRIRLPYAPGLPEFSGATRYVDARLSYRFKSGIEVFVDARNLGKTTQQTDTGSYAPYASGTPTVVGLGYGGARYSAGVSFRR